MNPNLPVGGSAFDIASTTGAETSGLVVVGLSYGFTHFGSHYQGSDSIDPVRTEQIGAHLFDLSGEYHLDRGLTAGLRVPIGTIAVEPVGAQSSSVTGLGDIELGASYDLGRIWGLGGFKPSVRIRPTLSLPTGETQRVVDGDAPPNIISLGTGTVTGGLEVQASKYLTKSWAVRGQVGGRLPLGFNDSDIKIGPSIRGGVGGLYRVRKPLTLSLDASLNHRRSSEERVQGELVNSGGTWLSAQLAASYAVRDNLIVGARARLPIYRDVNGEQITQTFGVGGFVAMTFGGGGKDEHGDEHAHGDEHEHGDEHAHGDEHEGGDEQGDEHEHGDEHAGGDKHEHGDKHAGGGDVKVLASGGASFQIADAAVDGKVVVIDFWADWCHPCKAITAMLERRAARDSRLAVRKVEVPDFDAPVASEHLPGVAGLPVVWIVDRSGRVTRKLVQVKPAELERELDQALGPLTSERRP